VKQRKGFTLIELLVVVGIIVMLAGLLATGYLHVHRAAAGKETIAELHVCRGMLQEYERATGLAGIEAFSTTSPLQQPDSNAPPPGVFPVFVDPYPELDASTSSLAYKGTSPVPGSYWPCVEVQEEFDQQATDMSTAGTARYQALAVQRTHDVMYLLLHIPANRTTVLSIQSKRILEAQSGSASASIDQGPILLDGWGNPIIFVPRGGIHVYLTDHSTNPPKNSIYVVRSTGVFPVGNVDPPLTGNERPFWASAGEDGKFQQGEDNIYSFQD
jgi:prepilin-type N-terminal cleavage/methylation domain-containing protein